MDRHRQAAWPAHRPVSSSAARAKRLPGIGPSAQTLGRRGHSAGTNLATQPTASTSMLLALSRTSGVTQRGCSQFVGGVPAPGGLGASASFRGCRGPTDQSVPRRRPRLSAATALQAAISSSTQLQHLGRRGTSGPSPSVLLSPSRRPNCHWSGLPPASRLGRVALAVYPAPRGQVAFPAAAAQLER